MSFIQASMVSAGTITATPPDSVLYIILCIGCPYRKKAIVAYTGSTVPPSYVTTRHLQADVVGA